MSDQDEFNNHMAIIKADLDKGMRDLFETQFADDENFTETEMRLAVHIAQEAVIRVFMVSTMGTAALLRLGERLASSGQPLFGDGP